MAETNGTTSAHHGLRRDVAEFLAVGVANDDLLVIIASVDTRVSLEAELASFGIQLYDMQSQGRARCFDSHEVLRRILVQGVPNEAAFEKATDEILSVGMASRSGRIRAYCDLVDLLHHGGAPKAAWLVHEMWNDLCARHEGVMLAYTVGNLYREKDCAV